MWKVLSRPFAVECECVMLADTG